jgi:hypothetical protein
LGGTTKSPAVRLMVSDFLMGQCHVKMATMPNDQAQAQPPTAKLERNQKEQ